MSKSPWLKFVTFAQTPDYQGSRHGVDHWRLCWKLSVASQGFYQIIQFTTWDFFTEIDALTVEILGSTANKSEPALAFNEILDKYPGSRHAKSQELGNLDPGHLWRIMRTFFRNQRFLDYLLKVGFNVIKSGLGH